MTIELRSQGMARLFEPSARLDKLASGLMFGEGPVWSRPEACLYFVEIIGSRINRFVPGRGIQTVIEDTGHANGMTFDREGRLLVAGWSSRTVWRREQDGAQVVVASHFEGRKINTPNDLVVRSDGSIYWTDSDGGFFIPGMEGDDVQRYLDFSGVFRIPPGGGEPQAVIRDAVFPNGLAFSPDEKLLYLTDTRERCLRVFDVDDDGSVSNGRLFYELTGEEAGHADGMKVDLDGNVYCTGPGGVHVLSPAGELLGRILVPDDCTNMAWGDDGRTLYITAFHSLYRIRTLVPGAQP